MCSIESVRKLLLRKQHRRRNLWLCYRHPTPCLSQAMVSSTSTLTSMDSLSVIKAIKIKTKMRPKSPRRRKMTNPTTLSLTIIKMCQTTKVKLALRRSTLVMGVMIRRMQHSRLLMMTIEKVKRVSNG